MEGVSSRRRVWMKIGGLGNRQMYLLPQSIAAFSASRRLNFTTLGLDRQKTSPRSLFYLRPSRRVSQFVDPYSRFRPIERTDPHPAFRNLGKSSPSWPVSSRCRRKQVEESKAWKTWEGKNCSNNFSKKKKKEKKRSFDRQFIEKVLRERM